jgi:hypothetical protein
MTSKKKRKKYYSRTTAFLHYPDQRHVNGCVIFRTTASGFLKTGLSKSMYIKLDIASPEPSNTFQGAPTNCLVGIYHSINKIIEEKLPWRSEGMASREGRRALERGRLEGACLPLSEALPLLPKALPQSEFLPARPPLPVREP